MGIIWIIAKVLGISFILVCYLGMFSSVFELDRLNDVALKIASFIVGGVALWAIWFIIRVI